MDFSPGNLVINVPVLDMLCCIDLFKKFSDLLFDMKFPLC